MPGHSFQNDALALSSVRGIRCFSNCTSLSRSSIFNDGSDTRRGGATGR